MYRFFVEKSQIDEINNQVIIEGTDVNHIKNVLRMKEGEEVNISDGETDIEYRCRIKELTDDNVTCDLIFKKVNNCELPSKVYIFQGLPKQEKMELVVQKCIELGAYEIVPVACKRSVVKLDAKKAASKCQRWNGIAEAAAKQSKRGVIPKVTNVMSMKEAALYAKENCEVILLPYELSDADTMDRTRELFLKLTPGKNIAVFIGPEGGFEPNEVEALKEAGAFEITLGRRILRTETAGLCVMSWLVFLLEGK